MKQQRKLIAMVFLLSVAGTVQVLGESEADKYEIPRKEISEYKSWLKVTPTPHTVQFTLGAPDGIDS